MNEALLPIEWNPIRLGAPAPGIVIKSHLRTDPQIWIPGVQFKTSLMHFRVFISKFLRKKVQPCFA